MSLQLGVPLFLVSALLQATILPRLRVLGGQPDLIVIMVLAWAILDQREEGMAWAFIGGLFIDLFSGVPLGISSMALLPIAFVVGMTEAQIYRANLLLPVLLTVAGALAYHAIYLFLLRFLVGMAVSWMDALVYVTLPSVAFDALLIIPFLQLLGARYDKLHPRRVKI